MDKNGEEKAHVWGRTSWQVIRVVRCERSWPSYPIIPRQDSCWNRKTVSPREFFRVTRQIQRLTTREAQPPMNFGPSRIISPFFSLSWLSFFCSAVCSRTRCFLLCYRNIALRCWEHNPGQILWIKFLSTLLPPSASKCLDRICAC